MPYIINGAFVNLSKFQKFTHSFSSGIKTDFVWVITRQFLTWGSSTLELEKHWKQYYQKYFLPWCFVLLVINSLKSFIQT